MANDRPQTETSSASQRADRPWVSSTASLPLRIWEGRNRPASQTNGSSMLPTSTSLDAASTNSDVDASLGNAARTNVAAMATNALDGAGMLPLPPRAPPMRQMNATMRFPSLRSSQTSHRQQIRATTDRRSQASSLGPVLVRAYNPSEESSSTTTSPAMSPEKDAKLPSVADFGIDGILRAIDPDIQTTLDAIAEICGRSRLSLANEYGSHMPPLGEIRVQQPPPLDHSLFPVEEASSPYERSADEGSVQSGGGRHEETPVSPTTPNITHRPTLQHQHTYESFVSPSQAATRTHLPHWTEGESGSTTLEESAASSPTKILDEDMHSSSKLAQHPHLYPQALLASNAPEMASITTTSAPTVSELRHSASANARSPAHDRVDGLENGPHHRQQSSIQSRLQQMSLHPDFQGWMVWLQGLPQDSGSAGDGEFGRQRIGGEVQTLSAEERLREILENQSHHFLS